jgi:hypothetical protein
MLDFGKILVTDQPSIRFTSTLFNFLDSFKNKLRKPDGHSVQGRNTSRGFRSTYLIDIHWIKG